MVLPAVPATPVSNRKFRTPSKENAINFSVDSAPGKSIAAALHGLSSPSPFKKATERVFPPTPLRSRLFKEEDEELDNAVRSLAMSAAQLRSSNTLMASQKKSAMAQASKEMEERHKRDVEQIAFLRKRLRARETFWQTRLITKKAAHAAEILSLQQVQGELERSLQSFRENSSTADRKKHELQDALITVEQEKKSLEEELRLRMEEAQVAEQKQVALHATTQQWKNKCQELSAALKNVRVELQEIQSDRKEIRTELSLLPSKLLAEETHLLDGIADCTSSLTQSLIFLEEKRKADEILRRKLHNTIVELKGNIRVFCRVRPPMFGEVAHSAHGSIFDFAEDETDGRCLTVHAPQARSGIPGRPSIKKDKFTFDRVFDPSVGQAAIFEEVGQLITSALDGFQVCIFAYGQTGSGKSYTMQGPEMDAYGENAGIIPRSLELIFNEIAELKTKGWQYTVTVSFVEIYNEILRDLLSVGKPSDSTRRIPFGRSDVPEASLSIRHSENGDTTVVGCKEFTVTSIEEVSQLLQTANEARSVGSTLRNANSSRSHSVFRVKLEGYCASKNVLTKGTVNLVDLAGSERLSESGSTGDRLKEAQNINKSLSCLGDVISALAQREKRVHVPYRNSKLTYLLQNALGGDCKTLMFVNISPAEKMVGESMCSLKFAEKVNDVTQRKEIRKHREKLEPAPSAE